MWFANVSAAAREPVQVRCDVFRNTIVPKLTAAAGAAARSVIRTHGGFFVPYIVFCTFCIGYSAVSGSLVSWGSAAAAGSGIPEVKTYLNGVHVPGQPFCRQAPDMLLFSFYLVRLSRLLKEVGAP